MFGTGKMMRSGWLRCRALLLPDTSTVVVGHLFCFPPAYVPAVVVHSVPFSVFESIIAFDSELILQFLF